MNLVSPVDLVISWWNVELNEYALGRFNEDDLHFVQNFRRVSDIDDVSQSCAYFTNIPKLSWTGSWFDTRYGNGKFYVCPDDNDNISGVYSELGWIEGEIRNDNEDDDESGDTISGIYYNSGARNDVDQGEFEISLTNHGHSFEGFYVVNDEVVEWKQDRIDATGAFSDQCYTPDFSSTVAGKWYYGKHPSDIMDICVFNDGTIEMSYSYNNGDNHGYGIGYTSSTGPHSIRTTWFEKHGDGIGMYRISSSGALTEFFWEGYNLSFDIEYDVCDDEEVNFPYWGQHSVNHLRQMSPVQDRIACKRNRHLYDSAVFDVNSSDASALQIFSLVLGVFLFLL